MSQPKPTSFLLYTDQENAFNLLSLENRGRLITQIFHYVRTGETEFEDTNELVRLAFAMLKGHLDRDREQYERKCRINSENAKKRTNASRTSENFNDQDINESVAEKANGSDRLQTPATAAYNNNNKIGRAHV